MCWRNWRLKILITFLCLVAIYIIIGITCGFGFQCFKSSHPADPPKPVNSTQPVNPPPYEQRRFLDNF